MRNQLVCYICRDWGMNDLISTYGGELIVGRKVAGFSVRFWGRHAWKPVHWCPFATSPGKASHRPLNRLFRSSKANGATRACLWQDVFKIWMLSTIWPANEATCSRARCKTEAVMLYTNRQWKDFLDVSLASGHLPGERFFFGCLLVWPPLLWPATRAACSGAKQKASWEEGLRTVKGYFAGMR